MSPFTKDEIKQLRNALLAVYPSKGDLEIFVADELGENLEAIANEGNLTKDVFKLVQWANAKGRINELFQAFCTCNTTNPIVTELQRTLNDTGTTSEAAQRAIERKSEPSGLNTPRPSTTVPETNTATNPIEVFISYSHKDEDLKDELYVHLANLTRQGKIQPWQDRAIEAGTEWDAQIKARLESAGIILLLITPRFIASEYCFDKEMQRAMERHEAGSARVIPIIMKPCDWKGTPFSRLQVLPKEAKPVTKWDDQDEALLDVVTGIRRVVESLLTKPR